MVEFKRKPIEGVFPLLPLCIKDNQEIDYEGIKYNIELLEEKGIHGFIALGCLGQMNAVSEEEFNKVCDTCVNAAKDKKIACVVSSTATNTKEAIRRAKYAEDAGADGTMLPVPYAVPVTAEWAAEFYQMVDQSLSGDLAILLYNYPPLTGFNITPTLWKEHLLKIKSIKAVKESNEEILHHDQVLITVADKVNFYSSSDRKFWHDSMLGAKGIVGILAWVALKVTLRYYNECINGNQKNPWILEVYKTLVNATAIMGGPGMPPQPQYKHGYLNALAEIGGAKAGLPRKPYGPLPREARIALEKAVSPLTEKEKELN